MVTVAVSWIALLTEMLLAVTPVLLNETVEPSQERRDWPVICTPVNTWPCWPLLGTMAVTTGVPAVTVNRLLPVAVSAPVVTLTLERPKAALAAMVTVAVRWVASVTEMLLAVTPGLLNETVE